MSKIFTRLPVSVIYKKLIVTLILPVPWTCPANSCGFI